MKACKHALFTLCLITGILFFASSHAADPTIEILGEAIGSGNAEMKAAFDRWLPMKGKTYPLPSGTSLKAGDGALSLLLKDGTKVEAAKNSEFLVGGLKGETSIYLNRGSVGFAVPAGSDFSVITPHSTVQVQKNMIRNVNLSVSEAVSGVVTYDGKGTRIVSVSGTLLASDSGGMKTEMVTAGKSLYMEGTESGKIKTVQHEVVAPVVAASNPGLGAGLLATGVLVGGEVAGAVSVRTRPDAECVQGVASPSSPGSCK